MSTIQVKDVPDDVAEALRRRATAAGQSLQAYMRQHLIEFARQRTKSEYIELVEEGLAASEATGATAESIDEVLREARGE